MKKYWTAHVRGADFAKLKKLGFSVFSPMMDDYVFLEAVEENEKFLRKQEELGLKFLRTGKELNLVTEKELAKLGGTTVDRVVVGAEILVTGGPAERLDGVVVSREGDRIRCQVQGYRRTFDVELSVQQVVLRGKEPIEVSDDPENIAS